MRRRTRAASQPLAAPRVPLAMIQSATAIAGPLRSARSSSASHRGSFGRVGSGPTGARTVRTTTRPDDSNRVGVAEDSDRAIAKQGLAGAKHSRGLHVVVDGLNPAANISTASLGRTKVQPAARCCPAPTPTATLRFGGSCRTREGFLRPIAIWPGPARMIRARRLHL